MASFMDNFFEKYTDLLLSSSILSENGECQIWTGGTNTKGNYVWGMINVTYPSGKRCKINVARLSKMLEMKNVDLDKNLDASHLCHNSLCINPQHIILEPHVINNQRRFCVSSQKCTTHILHGTHYANCMLNLKLWFVIFIDLLNSLHMYTLLTYCIRP